MRYSLIIKVPSHIFILAVIIICSGFLSLTGCGGKKETVTKQPPVVEVIDVAQKDAPIYKKWGRTLDGYVNATIRAQVTGYLTNAPSNQNSVPSPSAQPAKTEVQ